MVVSGPSGVGKGTVVSAARKIRPELAVSISLTTREPRAGEVDGVDYYFVTRREFKRRVATGAMLEHAEFAGHLYGTPRDEVLRKLADGQTVVLEIELEGARQIKAAMPEALTVFIEPPSMVELAARLRSRGTEDAEDVDRRLRAAEREIAHAHEFQVNLVNTDVEVTAKALLDCLDAPAL